MSMGQRTFEQAAKLNKESAADQRRVVIRLLRYLLPHWPRLSLAFAAMLVSGATLATGPFLIGQAIDTYIIKGDFDGLLWLTGGLVILYSINYFAFRSQFYFTGPC